MNEICDVLSSIHPFLILWFIMMNLHNNCQMKLNVQPFASYQSSWHIIVNCLGYYFQIITCFWFSFTAGIQNSSLRVKSAADFALTANLFGTIRFYLFVVNRFQSWCQYFTHWARESVPGSYVQGALLHCLSRFVLVQKMGIASHYSHCIEKSIWYLNRKQLQT